MTRILIDGTEYTDNVEGLDDFILDVEIDDTNKAVVASTSAGLIMYGDAYEYIKSQFLVTNVPEDKELSVTIITECCDELESEFKIVQEGVIYCFADKAAEVDLVVRDAKSKAYRCLNDRVWWEDPFPVGIETNRIFYCKEVGFLQFLLLGVEILIAPLLLFAEIINAIIPFGDPLPDFDTFNKLIARCSQYSPSPLLKDIIKFNCDRCGLAFSSSILEGEYANTALFSLIADDGVDEGDNIAFQEENYPAMSTITLIEQFVNLTFNSEFRIEDVGGTETLVIERKDYFQDNNELLLDLESEYAEGNITEVPCYGRIQENRNSWASFRLQDDQMDTEGRRVRDLYEEIVVWVPDATPSLTGEFTNVASWGPSRFMNDRNAREFFDKKRAKLGYKNELILSSGYTGAPKLILLKDNFDKDHAKAIRRNSSEGDYLEYNYPLYWLSPEDSDGTDLYAKFWYIEDPAETILPTWEITSTVVWVPESFCEAVTLILNNGVDLDIITELGTGKAAGFSINFGDQTVEINEIKIVA